MGEVVLRERISEAGLSGVSVASAGVSAEENSHNIDPRARKVLAAAGYSVPARHSAHRATAAELRSADLILAMTAGHARRLAPMVERAGGKLSHIHLWREFDGTVPYAPHGVFGAGGALANDGASRNSRRSEDFADLYSSHGKLDVPDPWYGSQEDFATTLRIIEAGAPAIIGTVARKL